MAQNTVSSEILDDRVRAYRNFARGLSSDHTRRKYRNSLYKFADFYNVKDFDEMAKWSTEKIDRSFEDYIDHMNNVRKVKPSSVKAELAAIEKFFVTNYCIWHKEAIRATLPKNTMKVYGDAPITTEEIQQMLAVTSNTRIRALIHFYASTGARAGVMDDPPLRIKHLTKIENCYAVKIYAEDQDGNESKESHYSFLTPEAAKALDDYLDERRKKGEEITDDSFVFANVTFCHDKECIAGNCQHGSDKCKCSKTMCYARQYISDNGARQLIARIIRRAKLIRVKKGHRLNAPTLHQFRKRFATLLKNDGCNIEYVEMFQGHKLEGSRSAYLKPTLEMLFEEFKKHMAALTIDKTAKLEAENADLKSQKKSDEMLEIDRISQQFQKEFAQIKAQMDSNKPQIKVKPQYVYPESATPANMEFAISANEMLQAIVTKQNELNNLIMQMHKHLEPKQ